MSKYNSNNLILDGKDNYSLNDSKSSNKFRSVGFTQNNDKVRDVKKSNEWDKHGCQLKQNCLKLDTSSKVVNDAYEIIKGISFSDIVAYKGHIGIFRNFIQMHSKYKIYNNALDLPSSARAHFARYFKVKASMNMLQLRNPTIEYVKNLNKGNENGSSSNNNSSSSNGSGGGNSGGSNGGSSGSDTVTDNSIVNGQDNAGITDTTSGNGTMMGNTRGIYGTGEEAGLIVNEEDILTEENVNAAVYLTGNTDVYDNSTDNLEVYEDVPGFPDFQSENDHRTTILGLPPMYNPLSDPNGRVFAETTMTDLPLVYISPGRGRINKKFNDTIVEGVVGMVADITNIDSFTTVRTAGKMQDLRTLSFEPAFTDYVDYVQNLGSIVYGMMGLGGTFKWHESLSMELVDNIIQRSLVFYADKSTSISDGFSNEYSESPLTQSVNDWSMLVRQFKQLFFSGSDAYMGTIDEHYGANDAGTDTGGGGITGLINKMALGAGRILNGSQIQYPMMWQDSRMDRSYNLSFKFYSPYGNKEAIFQYVYLPLICLLALTLPRMDSIAGYGQPFYVNINSPGWFESSLGVVQSLTMERGGDDNLWTVDNLPQEINVTLTILDMYPTLSMTKNSSLMAFNLGLNSYFDCMAGVRTDKLNFIRHNITFLKAKLSKLHTLVDTKIPLLIGDGVRSFVSNILR